MKQQGGDVALTVEALLVGMTKLGSPASLWGLLLHVVDCKYYLYKPSSAFWFSTLVWQLQYFED